MTVTTAYLLVFGAAALAAVAALVAALVSGPRPPTRRWAWVTALVIAVLGTAFHLVVALGSAIAGSSTSGLLLGTAALVAATALAFIRPRWAAWVFGATALALPALLALVNAAADPSLAEVMPASAVAGFYSVRALITAVLLWIATLPLRGSRPPASPSPAPRSESVPTG